MGDEIWIPVPSLFIKYVLLLQSRKRFKQLCSDMMGGKLYYNKFLIAKDSYT